MQEQREARDQQRLEKLSSEIRDKFNMHEFEVEVKKIEGGT